MVIFHTDLDNTMIFSYRRDIGPVKRTVELCRGREMSFITEKTFELLQQVKEQVRFVPTTTRTKEQYERIDLGIGIPQYALTYNGGVLLVDGKEDAQWYLQSLRLADESRGELQKAVELLRNEKSRTFEIRVLKELFVYTKCNEPENVAAALRSGLDTSLVDVVCNGVKVYVVPRRLSKGSAIKRFKEYLNADYVIAAGDSAFDIPMFREADLAIAPEKLAERYALPDATVCMPGNNVYSEEVLEYVLNHLEGGI